jgi:DNA replication protein DnaC
MPKLSEINQKPAEFMQALKDFVARPRGYLLLAGKNGNGKSFSARAIFEHFSHIDNHFWNLVDLKAKWLSDYNKYSDTSHLLGEILRAPLLVLDDVGTSKPTDAFMDFLYCISDKRYENQQNLGTIITTNLDIESMRKIMGDAFVSRVASGICVRNDEPDRRSNIF